MRSIIALGAGVMAAFLTSSCDTTQPLQLDQQTFELTFSTFGASTVNYNVYDGFEDANGDMLPDDTNGDGSPDFFRHCLTRAPDSGNTHISNPSSIPWGFTLSISILREGQTVPEVITSSASATDPSLSVATYDTSGAPLGGVPPAPAPVTVQGRTFRFTNGRILSRARREVVAQTTSPLIELAPGTYGSPGSGRCSTFDPGPAVADAATSTTYPRQVVLRKGDTVTIEAFVSPTANPGIPINVSSPALSSTFSLAGTPMVVRGTTSEQGGPGSGFRFSYTTR